MDQKDSVHVLHVHEMMTMDQTSTVPAVAAGLACCSLVPSLTAKPFFSAPCLQM